MTTQSHSLTPHQLAWCAQNMPGFARSYADVCRRDADVAANRAQFERKGAYPGEGAEPVTVSRLMGRMKP